ncbi:hypothetical protein VNO77_22984 [Canavalia gladiata]|uniref:Uncharacterized protein n=1 Tax=Canavalia gladiata TaxID=3824 RepID=A0AAN9L6X9_CANGL
MIIRPIGSITKARAKKLQTKGPNEGWSMNVVDVQELKGKRSWARPTCMRQLFLSWLDLKLLLFAISTTRTRKKGSQTFFIIKFSLLPILLDGLVAALDETNDCYFAPFLTLHVGTMSL